MNLDLILNPMVLLDSILLVVAIWNHLFLQALYAIALWFETLTTFIMM